MGVEGRVTADVLNVKLPPWGVRRQSCLSDISISFAVESAIFEADDNRVLACGIEVESRDLTVAFEYR